MGEPELSGRTALVTGGGRGIGRATALALADHGARVVLTGRHHETLAAVAREIEAGGGQARPLVADAAREDQVRRLFDGDWPVDILINNAAIVGPIGPVATVDPQAWSRNIAVNLVGPFLTCHYALPGMLDRGWGRIVNVSAGVASGRMATWSAYSASKAGLETLTKVIAREAGDRGVRANVVRPGIVDTGMQEEIRETPEVAFGRENLERYRSYKEQGMLRDPSDPARLILWVLSPEAASLSGEVIAIDDPEFAAKIGVTPRGR